MRWIFFSLLILNAATLVWGLAFEGEASLDAKLSAEPFKYSELASLNLLGEGQGELIALSSMAPDEEKATVTPDTVSPPSSVNGKDLCELIGAFKSRELASTFVERLAAIDVNSEVKDLRLPAGPGYWVYLPPLANRKAALRQLSELQARKVDSYVIPKGELENGISLGLFSQQNLATTRFKEMEALGFEPKLDTIERKYREIWVMLQHGDDAKMSALSWSRTMEGFNGLERRQNFCLDVASQDNIH